MSAKDPGEDNFSIERFNLNAKRLKESKFFEWFLENKLNIEFLVTKGSPRAIFPPDDTFKDFLITFHHCIKDEHGSINAVSGIYEQLDPGNDLRQMFEDYHEGLHKSLYSRPFQSISRLDEEMRALTVLGIMDIFLYGEFIGDQPNKAEMFKKITLNKNIREFYWFEFYMTMYKCALLISQILVLNESLLKDFKTKQ